MAQQRGLYLIEFVSSHIVYACKPVKRGRNSPLGDVVDLINSNPHEDAHIHTQYSGV